MTLLVDGIDLAEQTGQKHGRRIVLAEDGTHLGLDLLQLVGVLAGAEVCSDVNTMEV